MLKQDHHGTPLSVFNFDLLKWSCIQMFIDLTIYSSGESLGEVSYETYPCQI